MNAIDKLSAVVIQQDARISEADKTYCQAHQKAYEAAKIALAELGERYEDVIANQNTILPPKRSTYEPRYIELEELSRSSMAKRIENIHGVFINRIVAYFNEIYHVSVSAQKIMESLLPKEPESPQYSYDINKEASEKYHEELQSMTVQYKDILDALFIQLGGRTFAERALDEIKEACHNAAWSSYNGKPEFEVKGDTIRFTSYACSCDSWGHNDYWEVSDSMRHILRGLAHYETGVFNVYPTGISRALEYRQRNTPVTECPDCTKVRQIKLFKNHHVYLKFASREYARQFSADYLGLVC